MLAAANAERRCRDDAYTAVRSRHPTDRGMATSAVDNLHTHNPLEAERRARAFSANARVFADRVNVYKRHTNGEVSPARPPAGPAGIYVAIDKVEEPPFKRLTFLQRSLKVSTSSKVSPDKKVQQSPKSPTAHHPSPLNNILELFRNRSHSDGTAKRPIKHSISTYKESSAATKDPQQAKGRKHGTSMCQLLDVADGEMGDSSTWMQSVDNLSPLDESTSPVMRKRSNSDNSVNHAADF